MVPKLTGKGSPFVVGDDSAAAVNFTLLAVTLPMF